MLTFKMSNVVVVQKNREVDHDVVGGHITQTAADKEPAAKAAG